MYDVVIIGAGPTGLVAAQECIRQNKTVLILEKPLKNRYLYSPTTELVAERDSVKLGGIGGTATVWHGQCVKLPRLFFEKYFRDSKIWTYKQYLDLSFEIEKIMGLRISPENSTLHFTKLKKIIQSNKEISLKISKIPSKIKTWESIFSDTLKNERLKILRAEVESLSFSDKYVDKIILKNDHQIPIFEDTLVILACNTIGSIELLLKSERFNQTILPGVGLNLYDHPHAITHYLDSKGKIEFLGNTFVYPVKHFFRIKLKKKYVVFENGTEIGYFEIHPVYSEQQRLSFLMKLSDKFLKKLFRYPLRKPERVELWVQIEQTELPEIKNSKRIFHLNGDDLTWKYELDEKDFERFEVISKHAVELLSANGFSVVEDIIHSPKFRISTAFHPSGTLAIGYSPQENSFNYEGMSNTFRNLMAVGGAVIGTGSWVNPTLPLMTITLGNIRNYLLMNDISNS